MSAICCTSDWWPHAWPELPLTENPTGTLLRAQSKLVKKNALLGLIGPPMLNPPCRSEKSPNTASPGVGFATVGMAGIVPTRLWLRPKKYPVPEMVLVPLRVPALTPPPEKPPCLTSYGATRGGG